MKSHTEPPTSGNNIDWQRWIGTPYRPGCMTAGAGGGIDCIRLAASIWDELGYIDLQKLELPAPQANRACMFTGQGDVLAFFRANEYLQTVSRVAHWAEATPWDVLVFEAGKGLFHVGLLTVRQTCLHVGQKTGCREIPLHRLPVKWVIKPV